MRLLILFTLITSCAYKKPLNNAELIVPPFIQEENPELYEIFKPEEKK